MTTKIFAIPIPTFTAQNIPPKLYAWETKACWWETKLSFCNERKILLTQSFAQPNELINCIIVKNSSREIFLESYEFPEIS